MPHCVPDYIAIDREETSPEPSRPEAKKPSGATRQRGLELNESETDRLATP